MILLRLAALLYWAVVCALSLGAIAYLAGFLSNRYSFSTVDSGLQIPAREAVVVDLALLALFGIQHSGMARHWFKRWSPGPVERATYLLATTLVLTLIFVRWEPLPDLLWNVQPRWPFTVLGAAGVLLVVWAVAAQGAARFFGWTQVWSFVCGRAEPAPVFRKPGPYRVVRHPMMLGLLVILWAVPDMSEGHALFAGVMTLYIFVGVRFEERDLARELGPAYQDYQKRVPMLIPRLPRR